MEKKKKSFSDSISQAKDGPRKEIILHSLLILQRFPLGPDTGDGFGEKAGMFHTEAKLHGIETYSVGI